MSLRHLNVSTSLPGSDHRGDDTPSFTHAHAHTCTHTVVHIKLISHNHRSEALSLRRNISAWSWHWAKLNLGLQAAVFQAVPVNGSQDHPKDTKPSRSLGIEKDAVKPGGGGACLEAETGSSQNSRPYRASSRIARATEKHCLKKKRKKIVQLLAYNLHIPTLTLTLPLGYL